MEDISAKILINAPDEKVWDTVSRVDNDPEFWQAIKKISKVSRERNVITREVVLEGDNRCLQKIMLFPMDGVHTRWLKGPITGVRDLILSQRGNATVLEVQISYRASGITGLFSRNISKYLREEAEAALQLIKERVEGVRGPRLEQRKLWADLFPQRN